MPALSAGIDDAGQHGEGARAGGRAGTVADFAENHPVTQRPFRLVVGERQLGMVQDLEDRVPIIEQLHRQRPGLPMRVVFDLFAGRSQVGQVLGIVGRQVHRGAFPSGVDRRHQGLEHVQDLMAKGPGFPP